MAPCGKYYNVVEGDTVCIAYPYLFELLSDKIMLHSVPPYPENCKGFSTSYQP